MKPDVRFLNQSPIFWADVRLLSQKIGYSVKSKIITPEVGQIIAVFQSLGLNENKFTMNGFITNYGTFILDYFQCRANILHSVEHYLMNASEAKLEYDNLLKKITPTCPMPMNKQSAEKKAPAYLTCIVNMLIQASSINGICDYDPRMLTTFTRNNFPVRILSRRVDGAYPAVINPVAIWEIKEYYYTTTFGSRVADGVYETQLDGGELQEMRFTEGIHCHHYLIIDGKYTWWNCGLSYLCRIIDMLHMGLIDEVIFGREVVDRIPMLVREWDYLLAQKPII